MQKHKESVIVSHSLQPSVAAANELTAGWCAAADHGDFVLSGCGVWPLLALLADAADGPARTELAAAVGMWPETANAAALQLLRVLDQSPDIRAALAVWFSDQVAVHDRWAASLPVGTVGRLTDQQALDAWARDHTDGLIEKFPLEVKSGTLMMLATALVAKTVWAKSFKKDRLEPADGPWRGHRGPCLPRETDDITSAGLLLAPAPVTRIVVKGDSDHDVDVHLLLGSGSPGAVLSAGIGALAGTVEIRTPLPAGTTGPGLSIRSVQAEEDTLRIQLPPFTIRKSHNLMNYQRLFGLEAATTEDPHGHFPAISDTPIYIKDAVQDVYARFHETGFEAAAVTAVGGFGVSARPAMREALDITATFDRPFGFLAVHRPSQLVIVAGWLAQPPDEGAAG